MYVWIRGEKEQEGKEVGSLSCDGKKEMRRKEDEERERSNGRKEGVSRGRKEV
jgi:hypothetical protein